jgi:hypothetical protein
MVNNLGLFVLISAFIISIFTMLGYYKEENINGVLLGLIFGSGAVFIFRQNLLALASMI